MKQDDKMLVFVGLLLALSLALAGCGQTYSVQVPQSCSYSDNGVSCNYANSTTPVPIVSAANATLNANPQTVYTPEGEAVPVVLSGTTSLNGTLVYPYVGEPGNGTLSGTAPVLAYLPDSGFTGNDSFSFQVAVGNATSAPATVVIVVSPPANDSSDNSS